MDTFWVNKTHLQSTISQIYCHVGYSRGVPDTRGNVNNKTNLSVGAGVDAHQGGLENSSSTILNERKRHIFFVCLISTDVWVVGWGVCMCVHICMTE